MDKFIARISLLVLVLAIATAQPSMAAMDCVAETPLPNILAMTQPASDVPQALARYVGTWVGAWQDRGAMPFATDLSLRLSTQQAEPMGFTATALMPAGISPVAISLKFKAIYLIKN